MHIRTILAAGGIAATFAAQALTLAVKDVKIAQRYPWNGLVDVDYTIECDDKDADVWVYPVGYDADYNQSVSLYTFTGEGANGQPVKAGKHRMTWDMAKDMGKDYNRAAFSIKLHAYAGAAPYLVIDLAAGANAEKYEVSYLNAKPADEWPEEYKTTKMVLKLIPPGTFTMGRTGFTPYYDGRYYCGNETEHQVTLTQPFYCGVFELTVHQYTLIKGGVGRPDAMTGLSYDALRGKTLGSKWPEHQQVDVDSIIGKLRSRTGITFDLPTEAQWEYACRGGTSGYYVAPSPNGFGLYGMSEQPAEWCLDWMERNLGSAAVVDPKGPASGIYRMIRGGYYTYYMSNSNQYGYWSSARGYYQGYSYNTEPYHSDNGRDNYGYPCGTFGCRLVALPAAQ